MNIRLHRDRDDVLHRFTAEITAHQERAIDAIDFERCALRESEAMRVMEKSSEEVTRLFVEITDQGPQLGRISYEGVASPPSRSHASP